MCIHRQSLQAPLVHTPFHRTLAALVFLAFISVVTSRATAAQDSRIINEIKNHNSGTALWWTGHNGWLIKSDSLLIGTDLILELPGRLFPSPVSVRELAEELDILFITHGHGDHFGRETARILSKYSDCIFVIPASTLDIAKEIGIPEERIRVATPNEPFTLVGMQVEPIRAIHGDEAFTVYIEANMQDCGYVITVNGIKFFQPGDSLLSEDQLFLGHVDVLFFSPTEHNTHIDRSVILINTLSPDYIFPQHHSTMAYDESSRFWAKGYPMEVKVLLSKPLQERYHIVEPGVRFDIKL